MAMDPVVHFELPAEDRERMKKFYNSAFGWKTIQHGEEMGNYVVAQTQEVDKDNMPLKMGMINGGFYQKTTEMGEQHPSVVISVEDINEGMEKVKAAGGKVLGEPMDIPGVGKYVSFVDTEGNRLSMMQPLKKM